MRSAKKNEDFTQGPVFKQMILFVIPIILTGVLQLLYNMADHVVVGQFSGDEYALAAVGSTASLTNLVVNLLFGIASGAAVVTARHIGARNHKSIDDAVHTAMTFSVIGGIAFAVISFAASAPGLRLMGTNELFIDKAILYMQIISFGIPASSIYNFGAAIVRSAGDSRTPLYILSLSGIINVLLNLVFVFFFNMSVDGVALATIISQYLSAIGIVAVLLKRKSELYALSIKKMRIDKRSLLQMMRFGIPAGIQNSLFSISNAFITSAVNAFPPTTVTAKTVAGNIDGFLYVTLNSFMHATTTFVAQNYGARNLDRAKRSILIAVVQATVIGITLGSIAILTGREISSIFISPSDPSREIIIDNVMIILKRCGFFYFICGVMEIFSGGLHGLGISISPMLVTVGGVCGLRILWITLLSPFESIADVYLCYPVSWITTGLILGTMLFFAYRKEKRNQHF